MCDDSKAASALYRHPTVFGISISISCVFVTVGHFAELPDDGATLQTCNTTVPVDFLLPQAVGLEE
jgi:hypothetical protein